MFTHAIYSPRFRPNRPTKFCCSSDPANRKGRCGKIFRRTAALLSRGLGFWTWRGLFPLCTLTIFFIYVQSDKPVQYDALMVALGPSKTKKERHAHPGQRRRWPSAVKCFDFCCSSLPARVWFLCCSLFRTTREGAVLTRCHLLSLALEEGSKRRRGKQSAKEPRGYCTINLENGLPESLRTRLLRA